ncbi:MAG: hypothetical protein Q4D26_06805 [Clostridia bacterium]|nr:hypothetical protein [Clostridia bacterium]
MIIVYLILICIYFALPWPLQIIFLIVNTFFPDPIPYVDEFMMYLGFFRKINTGLKIFNILKIILAIAIILVAVAAIYGMITNYAVT